MRVVVSSEPEECPKCHSENIGWALHSGPEEFIVCNSCGTMIQVEERDTTIATSLIVCPHCTAVGEIAVEGGHEFCVACGLDPNVEDVPSPILAHLFKEGSGIRKILEDNSSGARAGRKFGTFLRQSCGPHCSFEKSCPQAVGNMIKCRKEEDSDEEEEMSKHNRRRDMSRQRPEYKLSKKEKKRRRREEALLHKRAVIMCADGGWLSQHMDSIPRETINAEDDSTT